MHELTRKKILAKKRWNMQTDEESKHECADMRREGKKNVANTNNKAYDELYEEFDTKEGENTFYRLARQKHHASRIGRTTSQIGE